MHHALPVLEATSSNPVSPPHRHTSPVLWVSGLLLVGRLFRRRVYVGYDVFRVVESSPGAGGRGEMVVRLLRALSGWWPEFYVLYRRHGTR